MLLLLLLLHLLYPCVCHLNFATVFYGASNMAEGLMEISRLGIQTVAGNLTAEPSTIYIHQPRATLTQLQTIPYDQYEVKTLPQDTCLLRLFIVCA
jgi:hypothetical protein